MTADRSEPSLSSPPVWREVGTPPEEILRSLERRARQLRPALAGFGAVLIGGVVGFAVVALLPAAAGAPGALRLGWFFAVALPVALAEYYGTVRYLEWLDRRLRLQPLRIAVDGRRLIGELASGQRFDCPLSKLQLTRDPVAGDWYSVTLPLGRMRPFFLVPAPVAEELRAAGPFTP